MQHQQSPLPKSRQPFTQAVLFDVDGTLIRTDGAGREAMARAMSVAFPDTPVAHSRAVVAQVDFRGRTDAALVAEIVARLGHEAEHLDGRVMTAYLAALEETLVHAPVRAMPGVLELVASLCAPASSVCVGLLTGNVRGGARLKLQPVGLAHLVDAPGGFGDDHHDRPAIARVALQRLTALSVPPHAVVVVGDTQHDIEAGRAIGARTVAVATGWTDLDTLRTAAPDLLLADLSDPAPFWQLLRAL